MINVAKPSTVIELSTVYFCAGPLPHAIALRDCGLQLPGAAPNVLTALYGNQSKQDGFMAAREYAERNRLQFTVIDFLVALDHRINPGLMKSDEWANHDFFAFQRLSRGAADEIQAILQDLVPAGAGEQAAVDGVKPNVLLLQRPELIGMLLSQPQLRHVKVVAHQARPIMSERALTVGSVPFVHWNAIKEASCRLNPTTRITLDQPRMIDSPTSALGDLPSSAPSAPTLRAGARPKAPRPR